MVKKLLLPLAISTLLGLSSIQEAKAYSADSIHNQQIDDNIQAQGLTRYDGDLGLGNELRGDEYTSQTFPTNGLLIYENTNPSQSNLGANYLVIAGSDCEQSIKNSIFNHNDDTTTTMYKAIDVSSYGTEDSTWNAINEFAFGGSPVYHFQFGGQAPEDAEIKVFRKDDYLNTPQGQPLTQTNEDPNTSNYYQTQPITLQDSIEEFVFEVNGTDTIQRELPAGNSDVNLMGGSPVSLEEQTTAQLSAYPVPCNNQLNINYNEKLSDVQVELYNTAGQRVQAPYSVNNGQIEVNTQELKSGMYISRVGNDKAGYETLKVVKE